MGYETTQAFEQAMKDGLIKSVDFIPKYFELLEGEARAGLANMRKTSKFARENFNRTVEIITQKLFTEGLEVGLVRFFNLFTEVIKSLEPVFVFAGRTIRDFTESIAALTKILKLGDGIANPLSENMKKLVVVLTLLFNPLTGMYTLAYLLIDAFNKIVREVSVIMEMGFGDWLEQQGVKFTGWFDLLDEWGYTIGAIVLAVLVAFGKLRGLFGVKLPFVAGIAVKAIDRLTGSISRLAGAATVASGGGGAGGGGKSGTPTSGGKLGGFVKNAATLAAIPFVFAGISKGSEMFSDQAKAGDATSQLGLMATYAASGALLGSRLGPWGALAGGVGGLAYANYEMYSGKMNLMKGTPLENKPAPVDNKFNINITIKDGKQTITGTDGMGRPINPNSVSLKYADQ